MSQQQHIQHHQHQTHYVHYNPQIQQQVQQQQVQHHQHVQQYVQHQQQPQQHQHQQQPQQQHQPQQHPQHHHQQQQLAVTHVVPQDIQHAQQQQQQQPIASTSAVQQGQQQQQQPQGSASASGSGPNSSAPLIARGDWTKDLVHLAKTAELKKHALTLQLHTAHILSAHATLEQKGKTIQDLREQKNKLESERTRLLNALREVNEDRDKVDLMESTLEKECRETRNKIAQLTETDYAIAKRDVDRLRAELGQPPMPSLQSTLEEKTAQYLNERRLSGNDAQSASTPGGSASGATGPTSNKRSAPPNNGNGSGTPGHDGNGQASKRPRGRPKGSKNKSKGVDGD